MAEQKGMTADQLGGVLTELLYDDESDLPVDSLVSEIGNLRDGRFGTQEAGIWVRLDDGSEYQITIVQSTQAQ